MRVLVAGGTGFVGRFIVERLLADGHVPTVLGRNAPAAGSFSRPVDFVEGHLDPTADPSAAFEGIDHFVHAALDHRPQKFRGGEGDDPAGFVAKNRDGSLRLFESARCAGISRVVFLSSRAVYGSWPDGRMLDEETEPMPDTLYGAVKRDTETALMAMHGAGFSGVSLRVTGVYGPAGPGRAHKWSALFADFLAGRPIAPRVGTEVHGRDVAAAVSLMLTAPEPATAEGVFNVSDLVVDHRALLALVKRATGSPMALPEAADPRALNVMATERIRRLGWVPGGEAALERFVAAQFGG